MDNHTAPELLEAVGIDWRAKYGRESRPSYELGGDNTDYFAATDSITYTGPALGTPELDAILLVAGQRWCVENWDKYDDVNDALYDGNLQAINETDTFVLEWLLFYCDTPGHALARAIAEVCHA